MFDAQTKNEFVELLEAQKQSLLENQSIANEAASTVDLDQSSVGRLSRMDALQGQAMAKANLARKKQKLLDIEFALEKLQKEDEYGYCESCDEPINLPRLKFDPSVKYCLQCADKF